MKQKNLTAAAAAVCMLILILDSKYALNAATDAIELCAFSVIPSLFPFLVLCPLLTAGSSRILAPVCRLLGIPGGGENLLTVSILGGYPVGAQSVAQLYEARQISRTSARRLLMFCSNAGPAFLFGIVGSKFQSPLAPWILWCICILSSSFLGAVTVSLEPESVKPRKSAPNLPQALSGAVAVMGRICGWVVLFRIVTAFLQRWFLWMLPDDVRVLVTGLLELTGGCCSLEQITDEKQRFVAAAVMLNFGGLCVWLQTASIVGDLGTGTYLKGKLLQTVLAAVMAWSTVTGNVFVILLIFLLSLWLSLKKRSSNSVPLVV